MPINILETFRDQNTAAVKLCTPQSAWDSAGLCEKDVHVCDTGIELLLVEKSLDSNKQRGFVYSVLSTVNSG